jgi:hypothetical protein
MGLYHLHQTTERMAATVERIEWLLDMQDVDLDSLDLAAATADMLTIGDDFKAEAESIALWQMRLGSQAETIKREADRLSQRARRLERYAETLKKGLLDALKKAGQDKLKTDKVTLSIVQNSAWSVAVHDVSALPPEYQITPPPVADKRKLLADRDILNTTNVTFSRGEHLRIK